MSVLGFAAAPSSEMDAESYCLLLVGGRTGCGGLWPGGMAGKRLPEASRKAQKPPCCSELPLPDTQMCLSICVHVHG